MTTQRYDLIGDIHGQYGKLKLLLRELGYKQDSWGFRHPEGRKVIFLGDYIDRGPQVREVLLTVKAMRDSGDALAIMGNHEFNAVCCHTPDGRGGWLRDKRPPGYLVTLSQFEGREGEWVEWVEWMKRLPMALDLGDLRAVHACWDEASLAILGERDLTDVDFLKACASRGTKEFDALECVLKGPEISLPDDKVYRDKEGQARNTVRVRWWDLPGVASVGEVAMPAPYDEPEMVDPEVLKRLPNYPVEAPPVFFGHYWMKFDSGAQPQRHNIICLDYSAASVGPLVAYRWEGGEPLSAERIVAVGWGKA